MLSGRNNLSNISERSSTGRSLIFFGFHIEQLMACLDDTWSEFPVQFSWRVTHLIQRYPQPSPTPLRSRKWPSSRMLYEFLESVHPFYTWPEEARFVSAACRSRAQTKVEEWRGGSEDLVIITMVLLTIQLAMTGREMIAGRHLSLGGQ